MGTLRYSRTGDPCLPLTNFEVGNYYSYVQDSSFPDGTIAAATAEISTMTTNHGANIDLGGLNRSIVTYLSVEMR